MICRRVLPNRGNLSYHLRTHNRTKFSRWPSRPPDGSGPGSSALPVDAAAGGASPPGADLRGTSGSRAGGGATLSGRRRGSGEGGGDESGDRLSNAPAETTGDADTDALFALALEIVDACPTPPAVLPRDGGARAVDAQPATAVEQGDDALALVSRVRLFFEKFMDTERAVPLVRARKRARPGQFNSERLRALQEFVCDANLSNELRTKLYVFLRLWERTAPEAADDDDTSVPLRQSFKSAHAFRQAIANDIDKAVIDEGWMACAIEESGVTFEAFFRSSLREALKRLRSGKKLRLRSGDGMPAQHTDLREDTLDGDAFRACEAEVVASYGSEAFVIAIYVYSDSGVLSWSGAHKLYPVRIRVVNVETDEYEWITVAYVPSVATEKGKGGAERSRCLRIAVMQRVLFLALRDLVEASHTGVQFVDADGRELLGFPRVLMYLCDQPEERAILCLKPGECAHPCSACMAPQASMASPAALTFKQRTLLNTLHKQLQAFGLLQQGRERQRRLQMEKAVSMNSYPPALAAMAGLTTAPFLLYKIIGFDVLHILDLGVTRLLVHRLIDIFPSLCAGYVPLCGSLIATYAEGNGRTWVADAGRLAHHRTYCPAKTSNRPLQAVSSDWEFGSSLSCSTACLTAVNPRRGR